MEWKVQEGPDLLPYYAKVLELDVIEIELVDEVLIAVSKMCIPKNCCRTLTYNNQYCRNQRGNSSGTEIVIQVFDFRDALGKTNNALSQLLMVSCYTSHK